MYVRVCVCVCKCSFSFYAAIHPIIRIKCEIGLQVSCDILVDNCYSIYCLSTSLSRSGFSVGSPFELQ